MRRLIRPLTTSSLNVVTKQHTVRKVVQTPPSHLYSVITDVDSYASFLPYCNYSKILQRSDCNTMFDAILKIGMNSPQSTNTGSLLPDTDWMEEEYISRVKLYKGSITCTRDSQETLPSPWIVQAKSIQSQKFHSLSSEWKLTPQEQEDDTSSHTTFVEFQVQMSVTNPLVALALDTLLEQVAQSQVEAFEVECRRREYDP